MAHRLDGPAVSSDGGEIPESDALTPRGLSAGAPPAEVSTRPEAEVVAPGRPEGATPGAGVDLERAQARAKLKASLFQIESEPLRVGRFTILSRLGQGGMGVVYSAFDEDLDRRVAIKVMLPEASSTSARDRMRREAQAMARLSHPNIVTVHEVGDVGGQVYIAMEFVRGGTLSEWLREQDRSWVEVLSVFEQAGRGLQAAHQAGLVHRDFKPQNVMLGDDGSVKVLDFGLARDESSFHAERQTAARTEGLLDVALTQTGALVGTPAYMAPEQHEGRPVTARSDQFSFCAALFMGLYGVLPFEGKTIEALMLSICSGEVREVPSDSPVPAWVHAIVQRGLSVEPEQRYASMAELLRALSHDPQAQRRRRVRVGALAVALLGGGYGLAQVGGAASEPCPDAREALEGVWDDEQRAVVDAALSGSGSAIADQTWMRLEPALDDYADRWASVRSAACEQRHQGLSSDLLYERRIACLDQARAGLQTVVEVLGQGDAAVTEKAIAAVGGLPPPDRCEDAEVVLAEFEVPPPPVADAVAEARQQLSRARVLEDLGRFDEGLRLAEEALEQGEALGYRPLRAEALLRRGTTQLTAREGDAADQSLSAALWLALETNQSAVAAEAAARRLYVRSELLGRPDDGMFDVPLAHALVARVEDERLRALVLNNEALLYFRQGQAESARSGFQAAIDLKRRVFGEQHLEVAYSTFNLALLQRQRGDLGAAARSLETVEQIFERALGAWHPVRAAVITTMASVLIDQGRFDEAAAAIDRAEQIQERLHGDNQGGNRMYRLELLRHRSSLALRRRHYADARTASEEALQIAVSSMPEGHPGLLPFHLDLAEVMAAEGQRTEAEAHVEERLAALDPERAEHQRLRVGAWSRVGRLQVRFGEPAAAVKTLQRALEVSKTFEPREPAGEAWLGSWLGRARLQAQDPAEADAEAEAQTDRLIVQGAETLSRLEADASPRRLEAVEILAELRWSQDDVAAAVEGFANVESIMAQARAADDPALAWVRARLARARRRVSPQASSEARATLERSVAVLDADPGWSEEAARAKAWLSDPVR